MKWFVGLCLLTATTAQAEIYRWRDARGTVHYTNSEYEIPARYRSKAVVLNLGLPNQSPATAPAPGAATLPPAGMNGPAPVPPGQMLTAPAPAAATAPPPAVSPRATVRHRQPRDRSVRGDE